MPWKFKPQQTKKTNEFIPRSFDPTGHQRDELFTYAAYRERLALWAQMWVETRRLQRRRYAPTKPSFED
jgi:hypothetical protein